MGKRSWGSPAQKAAQRKASLASAAKRRKGGSVGSVGKFTAYRQKVKARRAWTGRGDLANSREHRDWQGNSHASQYGRRESQQERAAGVRRAVSLYPRKYSGGSLAAWRKRGTRKARWMRSERRAYLQARKKR